MDRIRFCITGLFLLVFLGIPAGCALFFGLSAGLAAAGILLLLLALASAAFAETALHRRPGLLGNVGPTTKTRAQQDSKTRALIARQEALLAPVGWEDVHITTKDNLKLHGYYIPGKPGETRTVVLVHGYSVRALQMAEYALYWRDTFGVNVLMPDARAHGQSEGHYTGMGYYEKIDVLQWLDFLLSRMGDTAAFALHGISMGGATVLSAASFNPPPQLRFVVEDCGFTSAWAEFSHQLRCRMHLPVFPILHLAALWARVRAGYWLHQSSALNLVKNLQIPALFVHGEADHFVPTWMVHPLFEGAASTDKTLVLVPHAAHVKSFSTDNDGRYRQEISRLVELYMPPSDPL